MMPFFGAGALFCTFRSQALSDNLIADFRNVSRKGFQKRFQIKMLNTLVEILVGVLGVLLHLCVVHGADRDVIRLAHRAVSLRDVNLTCHHPVWSEAWQLRGATDILLPLLCSVELRL